MIVHRAIITASMFHSCKRRAIIALKVTCLVAARIEKSVIQGQGGVPNTVI